jgi:hypothetical protein
VSDLLLGKQAVVVGMETSRKLPLLLLLLLPLLLLLFAHSCPASMS